MATMDASVIGVWQTRDDDPLNPYGYVENGSLYPGQPPEPQLYFFSSTRGAMFVMGPTSAFARGDIQSFRVYLKSPDSSDSTYPSVNLACHISNSFSFQSAAVSYSAGLKTFPRNTQQYWEFTFPNGLASVVDFTQTWYVHLLAPNLSGYDLAWGVVYPANATRVVITYTSTTACTAPTSVSVSNSTPDISSSVTLSWSGASAGTNNAITGYKIYRSTTSGGTYTELTANTRDVTTSESSGSFSVTSPDTYGNSYYYKVKTIGSVSGYDSDLSTAYDGITSTVTIACAAPTSIFPSTETPEPNSAVTITWNAGAAGDNNSITGYLLYRDTSSSGAFTTLVGETDGTTLSSIVYSSINDGGIYYYRVKTKGSAGTSYYSPLSTVYAQITSTKADTSCGSPTSVTISNDKPEPLDSLTISWSGATPGTDNAITGYEVYEDTTEDGTFTTLTDSVTTTNTSGSIIVSAATEYNITKYFRIKTIGTTEGGDSGLSSATSYKTYLYANYGITIPSLATLPAAIQYIVVYYDDTNVYKVLDDTVLDTVNAETVLPCSGVYNDSTYHRYIVTAYSSSAYVNADKARALTETEQNFYVQNGTTKTDVLNKQWTGTDWTTTLTSNNTSWSQAASSQLIQTADSITTKVSKGSIISEINQSAEEISINASKINLNGVVTANENFKILSDGSMEAVNGKFAGDLTAENTYCNNLLLRSGKEMTVGLWKIGASGIYYPSGQGFNYLAFLYHGATAYVTAQAPMHLGPDYTNPLYISGNGVTFTITNNEYSGGFIQDYYMNGGTQVLYQEICLVCNQGGSTYDLAKGNIGTQTHRWDVLWVDTAHYRDHPSDSSRTKKHDIKPIRETGELIDSLEPVEFVYNDDSSEKVRFGLIYEDTIDKLPEICTEDEKTGDLGITYEPLNTILLKEVQELRKRVKELEEKNTSYEERLIRLEALIV